MKLTCLWEVLAFTDQPYKYATTEALNKFKVFFFFLDVQHVLVHVGRKVQTNFVLQVLMPCFKPKTETCFFHFKILTDLWKTKRMCAWCRRVFRDLHLCCVCSLCIHSHISPHPQHQFLHEAACIDSDKGKRWVFKHNSDTLIHFLL